MRSEPNQDLIQNLDKLQAYASLFLKRQKSEEESTEDNENNKNNNENDSYVGESISQPELESIMPDVTKF